MFYFCKIQATGNDFVIVDLLKNNINYSFRLLAKFLCNRHFGVGGDGILILDRSKIADFKMKIYNQDGTEAEMCGNGIRCIVKYIYEEKYLNTNKIKIETNSGIKEVELKLDSGILIEQEVDMGEACFDLEKIPCFYSKKDNEYIDIFDYKVYVVSIGNPHAVIFVDNLENIDITKIGNMIENYKYFPYRINVEFVQIINKKKIKIRIWERGVGETLSCGTGVSAASIISHKYKNINNEIEVIVPGGNLKTIVEDNKIKLIGNADIIYYGKIKI